MKQHKMLILSERFYPSQTSTAYYLTKITARLAQEFKGDVHLFCAEAKTPQDKPAEENHFPANLQIHQIDDGKGDKNKLVSRLLKFCRISMKFAGAAVVYARRDDVVFSVTNPAFMIPILAFLKKILKFKFVLLAYDIFPENLIAAGLSKEASLSYRICKKVFDWGYGQADYVISIGRDMTETLKQKGVQAERIVLLPNWANTDDIVPAPMAGNRIGELFKLNGFRVFMFAGNFGRVQGIPDFLEVISKVSSPNAAFLFIGAGAMQKDLEQFQKDHPEKKLFCHPYLPMKEQNTFLNACSVAIVTLARNMLGLGVPSKSYFSMASGHPILYIGDKNSEVNLMLQESQCGWQVDPGDIAGCVKVIEKICSMPEQDLERMGKQTRTYLETHFSERIMLDRYAAFFKQHVFPETCTAENGD